jgi:glyoxylase-like metal-dependent hydrolase (beta-lactamase superfamily II)
VIIDEIMQGVYRIPLGIVNAYLIEGDGLTLVDTGAPDSTEKIITAVHQLGRRAEDIIHILITHLHYDHSGSLAAIKRISKAQAYMHPLDAEMVRHGQVVRPYQAAPGLLNQLIVRFFMSRLNPEVEAVEIEQELTGGETLDFAVGLKVIHTPGHSAGHLAFLHPKQGGLLIAGDAAANMVRLGYPPIYEDLELGLKTLNELSKLEFNHACFGHGKPLLGQASERFRQKWGAR